MRKFQNLSTLAFADLNSIKGGKRAYGLVKFGSAEFSEFARTASPITSIKFVNNRTIQLQNAQGDDICVEW